MTLVAGTSFGPYEIVKLLGAGGMGEVYLARDRRLLRSVALKVLPPEFATDADRVRRFQQEAHATAALNHPNIVAVYDVGHADGTAFLVSELLEGTTLREQLQAGRPWRLRRALETATQIARGLSAAHARGIVHRDLKPDNVFITSDGHVKVLDFGIAKLRSPAFELDRGDTATASTQIGVVLGTVGYMAPEQLRGQDVDARTDIFALGAILYEMLAGHRAFVGATPADTQTAVLTADPAELPTAQAVPAQVDRLVRRCLAKHPDDRFQSARDLLFVLESESGSDVRPVATPAVTAPATPPLTRPAVRRKRRWWLIFPLGGLVLLFGSRVLRSVNPPDSMPQPVARVAPVVRFQLTLPTGLTLVPEQPPAVSPDGLRLALVAVDRESNRRQVYLRSLNNLTTQPLSGTVDAQYPFWSPDSRRLGFFADGHLRLLELESGLIQDLAPAPNAAGAGLWLNDTIFFPRSNGPVVRVPASGGPPRNAAPFDASRESNQSVVGSLPDGRLVVSSQAGLFVVSPDGATNESITSAPMMPSMLARTGETSSGDDVLVFIQNGRLVAQRFDGSTRQLAGDPLPLGHDASGLLTRTARPFSASADVLTFVSRSDIETRPTWVDRSGRLLSPAATVTGQIRDLRVSPDGARLAMTRFTATTGFELLLVDLRRDTVMRVAPNWQQIMQPTWLSDGSALIAVGQREFGSRALVRIPAVEGADAQPILRPEGAVPSGPDVSLDGKYLSYVHTANDGNHELFVRPLTADGAGTALFAAPTYEGGARLSPDGKWMAYHTSETGPLNVFIRSFPDGREKQQVSLNGGQKPVWRPDGSELFYLAPDANLMSVRVTLTPTLELGERRVLFRTPIDVSAGTPGSALYDVSPDGQRFVVPVPTSNVPQPITVIFNWRSLLTPLTQPVGR